MRLAGDPLLNTFIGYPEGELARLIFHELAHQVAYAKDDTRVQRVVRHGGRAHRRRSAGWRRTRANRRARPTRASTGVGSDFRALTAKYRAALEALYASDLPDAEKRSRKAALYAEMRAEYEQMKRERWGGFAGYDPWFASANNASLGVLAAYTELVPEFSACSSARARTSAASTPKCGASPRSTTRRRGAPRSSAEAAAHPNIRITPATPEQPSWPTSASTAPIGWAWPRRARSPGNGPRRSSRSFDMACTVIEGDAGDTVEFSAFSGVDGRLLVRADHFDLEAQVSAS